jgi:hypothetical protein
MKVSFLDPGLTKKTTRLEISDDRKMGKMIVISLLDKLLACENIAKYNFHWIPGTWILQPFPITFNRKAATIMNWTHRCNWKKLPGQCKAQFFPKLWN